MAQYSKEYYAQKARERRALEKRIYKFHAWEKMPGESDKDFRRRFTKRVVVVVDDIKITQNPFGEVIKIETVNSENY